MTTITTATDTPTTTGPPPRAKARPTSPLRTERARRDRAIVQLWLDGRTPEGIARILEIDARQIRRILAASPLAAGHRADLEAARLTGREYNELMKAYRADPVALDFLAQQRIDRTRNGAPMAAAAAAPADDYEDALDHVERRLG